MDLDAYFERIGHEGPRAPTLEVLRAIHARHPLAIPFENLDVLRGVGVRIDLDSVERKLVKERRGGYCFEQNLLFATVLEAIGFQVTRLVARVRWQVPPETVTSRSHMVLRVDLGGEAWLADVGFGGLTPTAPVRLDREDPQATPHETLRVVPEGGAFTLKADVGGFRDVYRFTLEPQQPIDYEVANWFTSTHPKSLFVNHLMVTRAGEGGERLSLLDRELTIRRGEVVEKRAVDTPDELLAVLDERFGLRFPPGTRFGGPGRAWPS